MSRCSPDAKKRETTYAESYLGMVFCKENIGVRASTIRRSYSCVLWVLMGPVRNAYL